MNIISPPSEKRVRDFVSQVDEIVKKEKWVFDYDTETDSFYWTVPKIPDDARLRYVGDEFAFYVTRDQQIKGIFVEYFSSNFIKHHPEAKDFKEALVAGRRMLKTSKSERTLVRLRKNKKLIAGLESSLRVSFEKK